MIYDLSIFFFWFPCCPKSVDAFCVQFVRLKLKPLVLLNDLVRGGNEWSSGHVAILVVNFLLRTLRDKPQAFQLKGLKIPDWAVGEDAINLLCGQGVPGLLSVNAELGKTDHEMRQPLPPPKRAKHESAGDVPLQPKIESKHEPKSENHHGPHSAGEQEPEEQNENRKRQQNETEAENVPVRKAQRIERASARAVPVSNTNEANAVVQSAIDLLSSRSIRAADRRLEKNAKMILGKCGLDFNYHCPAQSLIGKDVHSDKEAARFLNPKHLLTTQYDDHGILLFQFLGLKSFQIFWEFLTNHDAALGP